MGISGAVGWVLAGPPGDATAVVPPPCPATLTTDGALPASPATGGDRAAVAPDVLVPMPLPQPRGPVSVRLCDYRPGAGGGAVDRQVVLDPTRTAELAGRLNSSPGETVTPPLPPAACPPGDRPVVLVFRYPEGDPAVVRVLGGPCGVVATSARVERGRDDVVRFVADLLPGGVSRGRAAP